MFVQNQAHHHAHDHCVLLQTDDEGTTGSLRNSRPFKLGPFPFHMVDPSVDSVLKSGDIMEGHYIDLVAGTPISQYRCLGESASRKHWRFFSTRSQTPVCVMALYTTSGVPEQLATINKSDHAVFMAAFGKLCPRWSTLGGAKAAKPSKRSLKGWAQGLQIAEGSNSDNDGNKRRRCGVVTT